MTRIYPVISALLLLVLFALPFKARGQGAPPAAKQRDQQEMEQAEALYEQQKYKEAAAIYEQIPKQFATSAFIPEAAFRLGYVQFLLGDYDNSVQTLEKIPALKGVEPAQAEAALALVPQVLTAKASKLQPTDPERKKAFEEAIKQFDVFLGKYPKSEEAESASYYKAISLSQIGRFDDAVPVLRANLKSFAGSPTILDSEYLLALTLSSLANLKAQHETQPDPTINANFNEAEGLFNGIITKRTDLALLNDAIFQLAELAFARAGFSKDPALRTKLLNSALAHYRAVAPNETVLEKQRLRIDSFKLQATDAIKKGDLITYKRFLRIADKERAKLATIQERPDETITARLKIGEVYFQLGDYDNVRVVFGNVKPLATGEDQKKQIVYFTAVSYALQQFTSKNTDDAAGAKVADQQLTAKAEEAYKQFKAAYPKDPMGDNLALLVGSRFVETDPQKAIDYFKESFTDYPEGRFKIEALTEQASALIRLNPPRYDEARALYQQTLAQHPPKPVAAAAEFGIATIDRDTGKSAEAVKAFKEIRDKYNGTPQGEQAAYFAGQMLAEKGDYKSAIPELQSFIKAHPESELVPMATYFLAKGQLQTGAKFDALASFKSIPQKYPKSPVAPYTYFDRAKVAQDDKRYDDCMAIMRELIAAYPDSPDVFKAFRFIADIQTKMQNKPLDATATLEEFVKSKPGDPNAPVALLQIADTWKGFTSKMPRHLAQSEEQRKEWEKDITNAIAASERIVNDYADSAQLSAALEKLLECQKAREEAKLVKQEDVEAYFEALAKKFEGKAAAKSKVMFTLASYMFDKDQKKAITQMAAVYDPQQKYAPSELDLYGQALIREKKLDDAQKVYTKLAADYPNPKGDPKGAAMEVQSAQAVSLFGFGKILEEQGKSAEAKAKFDMLKELYPWSPKMLEADYGIAAGEFEAKNYDPAIQLLLQVARANTAPAELRAKSMLLLAKINEAKAMFDPAIDNFLKIDAVFGAGVPVISAEGLWRGAQLLEKEGNGTLPMPAPATPASKKPAATPSTGGKPSPPATPAKH